MDNDWAMAGSHGKDKKAKSATDTALRRAQTEQAKTGRTNTLVRSFAIASAIIRAS